MMITKFGQSVRLEIQNSDKSVFKTDGLRVDFEIRIVAGYNRAKFTIYNLNEETVRVISEEGSLVKMFVRLHDQTEQELGYKFLVNNAVNYKKVPNAVTELYCISHIRKNFTSRFVNVRVTDTTLKGYLKQLEREVNKTNGVNVNFVFRHFPRSVENYRPLRSLSSWTGDVLTALEKLGRAYSFTVNEGEGNDIILLFLPTKENQHLSTQNSSTSYKLKTVNMRSTPQVGIVQLNIDSILDFNIKTGTILDTSELVTASAGDTFEFLTQVGNQIKAPIGGNGRFSTLEVVHKGSNYTNVWNTNAVAVKASGGKKETDCEQ